MKKTVLTTAVLILMALLSGHAQSQTGGSLGGNTGQQGSSPQNNARKANTGQNLGKGVPYNKDAEQQGQTGSKKTSSASRGAKQGGTSGQEGTKQGGKLSNKQGSGSSVKTKNQ